MIYTTNTVEGYHWQIRKVTKNKRHFPFGYGPRKTRLPIHKSVANRRCPLQTGDRPHNNSQSDSMIGFLSCKYGKDPKIALNLRNDFGIANDPKIAPKNHWHILIYAPLLYISLLPKVCLAGVFMFTKLVKTRNWIYFENQRDFRIFAQNKGYLTRWLRNVANFAHSPNRYQNPCKIFLKSCLSDWDIYQLIA